MTDTKGPSPLRVITDAIYDGHDRERVARAVLSDLAAAGYVVVPRDDLGLVLGGFGMDNPTDNEFAAFQRVGDLMSEEGSSHE